MSTIETPSAQMTEATVPLYVLQQHNKTIGVVQDGALVTLPFSAESYTDYVVHSAEEAAPFLLPKKLVGEVPWAWCARVCLSLSSTSPRHGLLVRNLATCAAASLLLAADEGAISNAMAALVSHNKLWSTVAAPTPSAAGSCTTLHVYLVSEPAALPDAISTSLTDLPVATDATRDSFTTRVVVGNTPAEVVAMLQQLITTLLFGDAAAATTFTGTEVCWPKGLGFPVNVHARSDRLRRLEHAALLLPRRGLLHPSNAIRSWSTWSDLQEHHRKNSEDASGFRTGEAWERHLVTNPHLELPASATPSLVGAETLVTSASYDYYHYRVDGFRDDGWGCAYRSLQTVLSWFQHAGLMYAPIPSVRHIQEILYEVDPDKASKKQFVGSCDWIGSFEIMLVLQHYMPGLDCTIRRLESGRDLETDSSVQLLLSEHFRSPHAAPVMIGGSSYAHTILGVHMNVHTMEARYLVLDPHYSANPTQLKTAVKKGFVGWKEASKFFEASSWYNLCIPRADLYDPR